MEKSTRRSAYSCAFISFFLALAWWTIQTTLMVSWLPSHPQQQHRQLSSASQERPTDASHERPTDAFYPFVIRDARRLTDVRLNTNFYIYDYVDLSTPHQSNSKSHELFLKMVT